MNIESNALSDHSGRKSFFGILALLTACFFWAASFIATKIALQSAPPLTVVALRLVISSFCFMVWAAFKKITLWNPQWQWGKLLLLSLFGTGLHLGIQTIGMKYTTAVNASIYAITGPVSIAVIAAVFLREKCTLKKMTGILLAIVGVCWVLGFDALLQFSLKGRLLGDMLVFTSIFLWGLFTVLGKHMTVHYHPVQIAALATILGCIYMVPISIIEMGSVAFSVLSLPLSAWAAIGFLGITCSFLATLLYLRALVHSESQKVGVFLYTIPPMTYAVAVLFLGETISADLLVGAVLVFAGVYLTEKG